jgi:hypothetical protein
MSNGSISAMGSSSTGNGFQVTGSHTYEEEGAYTITVNIHDTTNNLDGNASSSAAVADAALKAAPVAVCSAEGVALINQPVATFTDAGGAEPVSNYRASIDWGDDTPISAGAIVQSGSTFQVLGSHTYASEGDYAVHVSIQDEGGSSTSLGTTAIIGGFVTGLYHDVLDRAPDATGLFFWVTQLHAGLPRVFLANAFWTSPEHRGLQVDQFYQTFFQRAADATGRQLWKGALLGGAAETDVCIAFLTSPEYTSSHADNASYVRGLYTDALGRMPDAAGFAYWEQILQNGVRHRADSAYYFLTSREAFLIAIDDYYQRFLGRKPSSSEEQAFLDVMQNGTSPAVITSIFLGSGEYLAREIALACQMT